MAFYKDHYQVVVIGGALSGLSAAIQLEAAGYRDILVLEKHNLPGGLATSYVRNGFEIEATLHEMASIGPKDHRLVVGKFFEDMGVDIDWCTVPETYRLIVKDDDVDIKLHDGIKTMSDEIGAQYPEWRDKVYDFMCMAERVYKGFNAVAENDSMSKVELLRKYPEFVKTMGYSTEEVFKKYNFPKPVEDILSAYWIYMGNNFHDLPFTAYCLIMVDYFTGGSYVAKGLSHEMAMRLQKKAEEGGAQIEFCQEVEKILVKDGRVTGVRTKRGDTISCDYVISGAYPQRVYSQMIEPKSEVPQTAIQAANTLPLSLCTVSVMMILKGTPEELGIKDYNIFSCNHFDTNEFYDQGKGLGGYDFLSSICLNLANPDCCPEGYTAFSITNLPLSDGFQKLKKEDYYKAKRMIADEMIHKYEEMTGNIIHDKIVEVEVSSPVTIAHYVGSWKGTIYGYSHSMGNHIVARAQMAKQDEYIKGLSYANTTGMIGNGMSPSIMNGRLAAKSVIESEKQKGENA